MKLRTLWSLKAVRVAAAVFAYLLSSGIAEAAYPVNIIDAAGQSVSIAQRPSRVVSLVPSATEILFALGCGDAVTGITHHDPRLPGTQEKSIVGGFFSPSLKRIMELNPDMLIVAPLHTRIREHFEGRACRVLVFDTRIFSTRPPEPGPTTSLWCRARGPGSIRRAGIPRWANSSPRRSMRRSQRRSKSKTT